jgi:hypothetical protein
MKELIVANWASIVGALLILIWIVVRLTPTKKDDIIFNLITKVVKVLLPKVWDIIKDVIGVVIPDRKKKGGKHS